MRLWNREHDVGVTTLKRDEMSDIMLIWFKYDHLKSLMADHEVNPNRSSDPNRVVFSFQVDDNND